MSLTSKERNLGGSVSANRAQLSLRTWVSPAGTVGRHGVDTVGVECSAGLETPGATTAGERECTAWQPKQRRLTRHGTGYLCRHAFVTWLRSFVLRCPRPDQEH